VALLGNLTGSSQFFNSKGFYNDVAITSLRLDGGSQITLDNAGSATSNKIATISTWFKRADELTTLAYLFHSKNDGSFGDGSNGLASFSITLDAADTISVVQYNGNTSFNANQYDFGVVASTRKFRDMSSWYHLVVAIDTTQGSGTTNEADRIKMYVNGEQQTVVAISDGSGYQDFADENQLIAVNQDGEQRWGGTVDDGTYAHVYLAETNVVDGLQLDASYFGETKNGVWIPKAPVVSDYGNHGYRLQYKQSSVGSGSSSTIGADTSGKDNHFTSTNVVASDCAMPDSPENNFCTILPTQNQTAATLSEGSLKAVGTGSNWDNLQSTFAVSSGKWYWEVKMLSIPEAESFVAGIHQTGFASQSLHWYSSDYTASDDGIVFGVQDNNKKVTNTSQSAFTSDIAANDIVQFRLNLDDNELSVSVDGSDKGKLFDITANVEYTPALSIYKTTSCTMNFGQDSTFVGTETAGGNADENGNGDFHSAVPSGYLSLCSANLPEPTIGPNSDTQADEYFDTLTWTGNGADRDITSLSFKPDLVWTKSTGVNNSHYLFNSTRGVLKDLESDNNDAESTEADSLEAFLSNGFSLGTNTNVNANGYGYMSWNWKANGGTTTTNDASATGVGSRDSVYQADTTAGFSIVTYDGDSSDQNGTVSTIAHGLGAVPKMIIFKPLDNFDGVVYHAGNTSAPETDRLVLFSSSAHYATSDDSGFFNDTAPTSTVFTIGARKHVNSNGGMIAFCWAEVEGYSKFGTFTGNADADGAFVYTGFRPAFVMIKNTNASSAGAVWFVFDDVRDTHNPMGNELAWSNQEEHGGSDGNILIDFLSNGFKPRSNSYANQTTQIYMAFASSPFKYANAR